MVHLLVGICCSRVCLLVSGLWIIFLQMVFRQKEG